MKNFYSSVRTSAASSPVTWSDFVLSTLFFLFSFSIFLFMAFAFSGEASARDAYPKNPNLSLTPGQLCNRPSEYRYPERIPYCKRNVDSREKWEVIREYDRLGYSIQQMNRQDFKIDHLIPLCAGGSNDERNLWPQHKSVFAITDPLEQVMCEKMARGHLSQDEAVDMILEVKLHLERTPQAMRTLRRLPR